MKLPPLPRRPSDFPAFPARICIDAANETYAEYIGITIRDYFAAKAMQGILQVEYDRITMQQFPDIADISYRVADAMLEARK